MSYSQLVIYPFIFLFIFVAGYWVQTFDFFLLRVVGWSLQVFAIIAIIHCSKLLLMTLRGLRMRRDDPETYFNGLIALEKASGTLEENRLSLGLHVWEIEKARLLAQNPEMSEREIEKAAADLVKSRHPDLYPEL